MISLLLCNRKTSSAICTALLLCVLLNAAFAIAQENMDLLTEAPLDSHLKVVILLPRPPCVNEQTIANLQVDSEDMPVTFQVSIPDDARSDADLEMDVPGNRVSSQDLDTENSTTHIMSLISTHNASAAIWFSCDDRRIHLGTDIGDWTETARHVDGDKANLSSEAVGAVVHNWLEALVVKWQIHRKAQIQSDASPPKLSTRKSDNDKDNVPFSQSPVFFDAENPLESNTDWETKKTEKTAPHHYRMSIEMLGNAFLIWDSAYEVGVSVSLGIRPGTGAIEIFVKGGTNKSMQLHQESIRLKLKPYPLGLGVRRLFDLKRNRMELAIELQQTTVKYITTTLDNDILRDGYGIQLGLAPQLGVGINLFSRLFLLFRVGLYILLVRPNYYATVDNENRAIHSPLLLQPNATVGLGFEFF